MQVYAPGENNSLVIYSSCGKSLDCVDEKRDMGVIMSNDLKLSKPCIKVVKTANRALGLIYRSVVYRTSEIILPLDLGLYK